MKTDKTDGPARQAWAARSGKKLDSEQVGTPPSKWARDRLVECILSPWAVENTDKNRETWNRVLDTCRYGHERVRRISIKAAMMAEAVVHEEEERLRKLLKNCPDDSARQSLEEFRERVRLLFDHIHHVTGIRVTLDNSCLEARGANLKKSCLTISADIGNIAPGLLEPTVREC